MTICGRKPRKLRCVIVTAMFFVAISFLCGNFSAQAEDTISGDQELRAVYVNSGDTIWSLVEENCAYNGDIRKAIYEVKMINGIENGEIYAGDTIYIPQKL